MFLLPLFLFFSSVPNIYAAEPIKILLVPGHDNEVWGAQYGNVKEADMNLRLANELLKILKKDKRFEVHITRDHLGYTTPFANFFAQPEEIIAFKENAKQQFQQKVSTGEVVAKEDVVHHNTVNSYVSLILYGINKWANDNKMDAVMHIHFNDYPRESKWMMGEYRGFSMYVPDEQMVNGEVSMNLAESIFAELRKKYISSTYPPESTGIIPEQSLIAIGSNGTLLESVRSVLVEYGYIYRFRNTALRHQAYKDMARLTGTGIQNYFFPK